MVGSGRAPNNFALEGALRQQEDGLASNARRPGAAPGVRRVDWFAPALATVVLASIVAVVWEWRIVAEATEYRFLSSSDPMLYFFPMLEVGFSELRSGRLFLWNPYQACGTPGLATGVVGFLYPPNLLYLFLPTAAAMELLTVLHLILAAVFTAIAARSFRISWSGATIAGCAYALTVPLSNLYFPNVVASLSWLPLGIAAIERVVVADNRRWLPALAVAASMPWLASAPQIATYSWFAFGVCAVWALTRVCWGSRSLVGTLRSGLRLTFAMSAALLLAAPQVLPTYELTTLSGRAGKALPIAEYTPFGRQPFSLALREAIVPPKEFRFDYVGSAPIVLAIAGLWARGPGLRILCLLLILWGTAGITAPDWYLRALHGLPFVSSFRLPGRVIFCAAIAVSLLAGLGTDAVLGRFAKRRRRTAAVACMVVTAVVFADVRYPHASWWVPLVLSLATANTFLSESKIRNVSLVVALFVLLLTDLVGFTRNASMLPYAKGHRRPMETHMDFFAALRERAGFDRILLGGTSTLRLEWSPKSAMVAKFFTVEDHEPLHLQQYRDFFTAGASGQLDPTPATRLLGELPEGYLQKMTPESRRFLNLLSVRYLVVDSLWLFEASFRNFAQQLLPVRFPDIQARAGKKFIVLEDPQALPRAYAVYQAECIDRFEDQLHRLRDAEFDPRTSVVLDGGCDSPSAAPAAPPVVSISTYAATRVEIGVHTEQPAWLILTDTWYPGWQAFVNGRREPIRRANGVVRAVRIPAGESRVEFRYVPWSFYAGVISAICVLTLWVGRVLVGRSTAGPCSPCTQHHDDEAPGALEWWASRVSLSNEAGRACSFSRFRRRTFKKARHGPLR